MYKIDFERGYSLKKLSYMGNAEITNLENLQPEEESTWEFE